VNYFLAKHSSLSLLLIFFYFLDLDRFSFYCFSVKMDIPLNTPICLKAHTGKHLHNEIFTGNGRCKNQSTGAFEQMMLIQTDDNKIIIQSRWNGRNLQVQESGRLVFANQNQGLSEKFRVKSDMDGRVYFISCQTGNAMQCNQDGFVCCVNYNLEPLAAWTIISPENHSPMTVGKLQKISLAAVTGAFAFPALGLGAAALVPTAMSTFGTVVAGVGTFHAPLAAGGCAATLQAASAALLTTNGVAAGAAVGAAVGSSFANK
jgi:hypothetical protein